MASTRSPKRKRGAVGPLLADDDPFDDHDPFDLRALYKAAAASVGAVDDWDEFRLDLDFSVGNSVAARRHSPAPSPNQDAIPAVPSRPAPANHQRYQYQEHLHNNRHQGSLWNTSSGVGTGTGPEERPQRRRSVLKKNKRPPSVATVAAASAVSVSAAGSNPSSHSLAALLRVLFFFRRKRKRTSAGGGYPSKYRRRKRKRTADRNRRRSRRRQSEGARAQVAAAASASAASASAAAGSNEKGIKRGPRSRPSQAGTKMPMQPFNRHLHLHSPQNPSRPADVTRENPGATLSTGASRETANVNDPSGSNSSNSAKNTTKFPNRSDVPSGGGGDQHQQQQPASNAAIPPPPAATGDSSPSPSEPGLLRRLLRRSVSKRPSLSVLGLGRKNSKNGRGDGDGSNRWNASAENSNYVSIPEEPVAAAEGEREHEDGPREREGIDPGKHIHAIPVTAVGDAKLATAATSLEKKKKKKQTHSRQKTSPTLAQQTLDNKTTTTPPPPGSSFSSRAGFAPAAATQTRAVAATPQAPAPAAHYENPPNHQSQQPQQKQQHARMPSTASAASASATSAKGSNKLHPRPSFRERFWTKSGANDFGDADKDENPGAKPQIYVPKHAASDFSRIGGAASPRSHSRSHSHSHSHHRHSYSLDDDRNINVRPLPPIQAEEADEDHKTRTNTAEVIEVGSRPPKATNKTTLAASPQNNGEIAENVQIPRDTAAAASQQARQPPRRGHRHSYSLVSDPVEAARAQSQSKPGTPPVAEEDAQGRSHQSQPSETEPASNHPSDYQTFLAQAAEEDRAHRAQVWRSLSQRSNDRTYSYNNPHPGAAIYRSGTQGTTGKRDSAYYSAGNKRASTSEEEQKPTILGGGALANSSAVPRASADGAAYLLQAQPQQGGAGGGLRRQPSLTQKISNYIKPPRAAGATNYEDIPYRPSSRVGLKRGDSVRRSKFAEGVTEEA
jgi:hypothetical protein